MKRSYTLVLLSLLFIKSIAQEAPVNFYKITNDEGLSQASVNVLFKDSEGFLWIGTDDGLNRFNGKQFRKYFYRHYDPTSIAANEVYAICEDKEGKLWFAHYNAGISCLDKKTDRFTRIQNSGIKNKSLLSDRIYGLHLDKTGFVWARSIQGISKIDPKTFHVQNFSYPEIEDKNVTTSNVDIVETRDHIWFCSNTKGILRIKKDGSFDPFTTWNAEKYGKAVSGIFKDSEKRFFVVSEKGLFKIEESSNDYRVEAIITDNLLFTNATKITRFDNTSLFWVATMGNGILVADLDKKKIIRQIKSETIIDNLISNAILYFLHDDEKNLFVATGRGVNVYSPYSRLFNIYENAFRKMIDFGHPIYAIHELNNGDLLLGTKHRGLYYFNASTYKANSIKLPEANIAENKRNIYHIAPFAGNFLISSNRGIFGLRVHNNSGIVHSLNSFPELSKIDTIGITNTYIYNDSIAYISSATEGMFKWNFKAHTLKQYIKNDLIPRAGPVDNQLMKVVATTEGNMILCTRYGFSIYYPNADTFLNITPGKNYPYQLPARNIKYAFDDGEYIWVTTFGAGVQKFNKKSRTFTGITTREGLPNDAVYAAVPGGDGKVYISTNNGLAVYNLRTRAIQTFTNLDGLPDNEFNGYSAYKSNSGKIFFSTLNGVVSISNKINISNPYSPNIVLTRFEAHGLKKDTSFNTYADFSYELPPGLNSLNFRFASLSYAAPAKNRYKVKLEGFDQEWIDLNDENEMSYSQLPPGKYNFKVMASNNSGIWSDKALSVKLHILPLWYQTWWFKLLVVILIAAILYALYLYRVRQLLRVAEIRRKISSDLHDDIGSTLSSINIYTRLAKQSKDNTKYIEIIGENTDNIIKHLDDLVWSINPKNDSASALSEHMASYAISLLSAKNIQCHFISNLTNINILISPDQRRHLFLCFKEMVNNVLKHSSCKNCYINFSKKGRVIYVEVRDDGNGFATESISGSRNGLNNFAFRAKELNGKCSIVSEPTKGTTVRLMMKM